MCGIFFSLCRRGFISPGAHTERLLRNRGPDFVGTHETLISAPPNGPDLPVSGLYATFVSTVLSLRGTTIDKQPLRDGSSGSVLCWNGEAWSIGYQAVLGGDSSAVFQALLTPSLTQPDGSRSNFIERTVHVLSSIRGPYAFVFYDAKNQLLYYGRDCLGRRSLLRKDNSDDGLILSSNCDNASGERWAEVEADGIYVLDIKEAQSEASFSIIHIPHRRHGDEPKGGTHFDIPFPIMNRSIDADTMSLQEAVRGLSESLKRSLEVRVRHVREAAEVSASHESDQKARIAILFSGGLDCTILARLSHDLLPSHQSIDLLNVAFENPRVHGKLGPHDSPYELCPDRITGRSSHAELMRSCPNRTWRLVEINIPYSETVAHRTNVVTLMHPHNTEMDLSISYALYFASRGIGVIRDLTNLPTPYSSTVHVLLSGLGADELFGGYQRHAVAFARKGYEGLIEELELDFNRLGKRNLGRDDRVISDSGKEARFPYLDEDFIAFALELPVWAKCDFASAQSQASDDPKRHLEPGKRILRMLAWELGMKGVAAEKKRAIQFGARTAKMETGKTKGTQVLIQ